MYKFTRTLKVICSVTMFKQKLFINFACNEYAEPNAAHHLIYGVCRPVCQAPGQGMNHLLRSWHKTYKACLCSYATSLLFYLSSRRSYTVHNLVYDIPNYTDSVAEIGESQLCMHI